MVHHYMERKASGHRAGGGVWMGGILLPRLTHEVFFLCCETRFLEREWYGIVLSWCYRTSVEDGPLKKSTWKQKV